MSKEVDIKNYIKGKVRFDEFGGGYFWDDDQNMIAEIRGFGRIQNIVAKKDGSIDYDEAVEYQNKIGKWIAEAINEKLENEQSK